MRYRGAPDGTRLCPVRYCGARLSKGRWICGRCWNRAPAHSKARLHVVHIEWRRAKAKDDILLLSFEWHGLADCIINQACEGMDFRLNPERKPYWWF